VVPLSSGLWIWRMISLSLGRGREDLLTSWESG
jgi:hypothetical protein